jgi:methylenetetrahydrofolate reductase (NADPH)
MPLPQISFEFFPPKTPEMADALLAAAKELQALNPSFVTVTFGAGGSTKSGTFDTAIQLKDRLGLTVGAHISYFGTPKSDLFAYADRLWTNNIRHLVVLRGDIPKGQSPTDFTGDAYFQLTSDFVEALRERHPFDISVGAYPEKHPDAPSLSEDIRALKLKCAAGATRAITQFFFDIRIYSDFLTKTDAAGIKTPIIPGLLPIGDFSKINGFAGKCGATIPEDIVKLFTDSSDPTQTAIDILAGQIDDLINLNVSHLHFYSLNRSDLILSAFHKLGMIRI